LILQISSRLPAGQLCRRAAESGLYVGYAPRLTRWAIASSRASRRACPARSWTVIAPWIALWIVG